MQHATCKIRSLVIAHSLSMCIVIMYFVAYLCLPNRYSGNLCRSFSFGARLLLSTKYQPQEIITKKKIHHDRKCPPIKNYKLHVPNSMVLIGSFSFLLGKYAPLSKLAVQPHHRPPRSPPCYNRNKRPRPAIINYRISTP